MLIKHKKNPKKRAKKRAKKRVKTSERYVTGKGESSNLLRGVTEGRARWVLKSAIFSVT